MAASSHQRDYLAEAKAILARDSPLLPQPEHLEALAKLIPFWPEPVKKVEFKAPVNRSEQRWRVQLKQSGSGWYDWVTGDMFDTYKYYRQARSYSQFIEAGRLVDGDGLIVREFGPGVSGSEDAA